MNVQKLFLPFGAKIFWNTNLKLQPFEKCTRKLFSMLIFIFGDTVFVRQTSALNIFTC